MSYITLFSLSANWLAEEYRNLVPRKRAIVIHLKRWRSLWNWFVGRVWRVFDEQARAILKCYWEGWIDSSMINSTRCTSNGPEFISQVPRSGSPQLFITPVPGIWCFWPQHSQVHVLTRANRHTYTHIIAHTHIETDTHMHTLVYTHIYKHIHMIKNKININKHG